MIRVGGREVFFVLALFCFVFFLFFVFFVSFLREFLGPWSVRILYSPVFFRISTNPIFGNNVVQKFTTSLKKTHLEGFNFNPADKNQLRVCFSRCIFSSKVNHGTIMSSIYNIRSSQCSPLSIFCKSL